jgi:DNA-binding NarL/FixJ family response regulator
MGRVGVLVVDDNALWREVASALLVHRGYTVVGEADCGGEAIELVAWLEPDAVLLDVGLRDPSGIHVARMLTTHAPAPAVLLTTAGVAIADQCVELCGARGFVLKETLSTIDLSQFWPVP